MQLYQGVILAGGTGTRLRPITETIPKAMVPVSDKPFIEHIIDEFKANGIKEIVILLGYLPDQIKNCFGNGDKFGVKISYSEGAVEDETGTRIRNAKDLLQEHFLLAYCDNYWPVPLAEMIDFFVSKKVLASTTVYKNIDGHAEYGKENNILVDDNGYVKLYDKSRQHPKLNGVDIGFFILNKKIVETMPSGNFSFETVMLPQLAEAGQLAGYLTERRYYTITNVDWLERTRKTLSAKKIIFLDRDGVINKKKEEDYVKNWNEFEFLPDALDALKLLKANSYEVFVVTNQRGIARNLLTANDLEDIHDKMCRIVAEHGGHISGVYYCPHSLESGCYCRKPSPGMLLQASTDHHVDLSKSVFVGDSDTDMEAGNRVGCKTILMESNSSLLKIIKNIVQKNRA